MVFFCVVSKTLNCIRLFVVEIFVTLKKRKQTFNLLSGVEKVYLIDLNFAASSEPPVALPAL